jgi:hypothetical protein
VITLRNPSDKPQDFTLKLGEVLELPAGRPLKYLATYPFGSSAVLKIDTTEPVTIHLAPFEVTTLESLQTK